MDNTSSVDKIVNYRRFAFPARIILPLVEALKRFGITFTTAVIRVRPYHLDACIFSATSTEERWNIMSTLSVLIGVDAVSVQTNQCVIANWGKHRVQYFAGKTGTISTVPIKSDEESAENLSIREYVELRKELKHFSQITGGMDIILHEENRGYCYPPLPDLENTIHIYPWCAPPGSTEEKYVRSFFGVPVNSEGGNILTFESVPRRGIIVGDGKHDAIQVIGNNWYFLFAVIEFWNDYTSKLLVNTALAETLHTLRKEKKVLVKPKKRFAFARLLGSTTKATQVEFEYIGKLIKDQEDVGRDLRDRLAKNERKLADYRRAHEILRDGEETERLIASLPEQLRRIRTNALVASGDVEKDCIQITTTPIVVVHEGVKYPMGCFTLSFAKNGEFHIWSDRILHKEGLPHPHMNADGTPCFGSATSAIRDAIARHRYADAVDFITSWLVDGYDHTLAFHKVTEWPCEEVMVTPKDLGNMLKWSGATQETEVAHACP